MSNERDLTHLTAERIQGFLDGVLPEREVAVVQSHVTSCSHCRAELESWQFLFSELGGLERLEPATLGACCFENGTCAVLSPGECFGLGGAYAGDGTACLVCAPFGACCLVDGMCVPDTSSSQCGGLGGAWQGSATV